MIWRIGDILDFDAQLDWICDAGFEAVSFHASPGDPGKWRGVDPAALERLNEMADKAGVVIGLELMRGFEGLNAPRRDHIGVTLDVGHMYLNEGAGYLPYHTIGGLVRSLSDVLVHLHVHDYDGTYDHIEVGTGCVDFDEVLRSLSEMDYKGTLCLELNPDRVSPEGIRRSADFLRTKIGALRSL